jgi:CTP:molybdopterin cytidylyltransferase MocA
MSSPPSTAALVLAAGGARRFGSDKLAADLAGRALLEHVLEVVRCVPLDPCLVVVASTGAAAAIVERFAATTTTGGAGVQALVNAESRRGLATSVRTGLEELSREVHGEVQEVVVLLGDQPGIDPQAVAALVAASRAEDMPVRARYADGPGHPVVLPRRSWPIVIDRLDAAAGTAQDEGVRAFAEVIGLRDVDVPGPSPRDVDVPGDLDALRRTGPDEGPRQRSG